MRLSKKPREPKAPLAPEQKKRRWRLFLLIAILLSIFVAVNVAIIFFLSSESKLESGNRSNDITQMIVDWLCPDFQNLGKDEKWQFMAMMRKLVRKVAHFLEFALLGFLSGWLMLHLRRRKTWIRMWMTWLFPALFCLLNAAADETYQIFSDRGPSVWDVCIDFAGALCGLLLIQTLCGIGRGLRALYRCAKRRRARRRAERSAAAPKTDVDAPRSSVDTADTAEGGMS